jgi:cytoskeletal protein RodZ
MSQNKVVSRTIAIALGLVCVVLAAGLIVSVANGSLNSDKQTISDLQDQVSSQSDQISSLTSQNTVLTNQLSTAKSNSTTLAEKVANLTSTINDYESIIAMNNSDIALDNQTYTQDANATTTLYDGTITYAGYAVIEVEATSNTTYIQAIYTCGDLDYNQTIIVGTSGTAIFPILPGDLTLVIGNVGLESNNATVTFTYYY